MSYLSNLAFTLIFTISFLMISGGWTYLLARAGVKVYIPHLKMVSLTPFAVMFVLAGVTGLMSIYRSAKTVRENKMKGWFMLLVGFMMVLMSKMCLELLLVESFR